MNKKIFVHAVNIHQGGGLSLLSGVIHAFDQQSHYVLVLDERMPLAIAPSSKIAIYKVKRSFIDRLKAEIWLYRQVKGTDKVVCFGNLPPLLRLKGAVTVFIQNRYLIDKNFNLKEMALWSRCRIVLERCWLKVFFRNADHYMVQTPSMFSLLNSLSVGRVPVSICPFLEIEGLEKTHKTKLKQDCFIYAASGEPHKNHKTLIEAWQILALEGIFPQLILTLDPNYFQSLSQWILDRAAKYKLNVKNIGVIDHDQMMQVYADAHALIYPSKLESFGLPLIEAKNVGLPILASELDYVRDVVEPDETFDPNSAISIVRAVKRFLGNSEKTIEIKKPLDFLFEVGAVNKKI